MKKWTKAVVVAICLAAAGGGSAAAQEAPAQQAAAPAEVVRQLGKGLGIFGDTHSATHRCCHC